MHGMLHFDCNATTAATKEVVEAMLPWLSQPGANPSATHPAGKAAALAVREARTQVAALIGAAEPRNILFTASGSESTATAFHGALEAAVPLTGRFAAAISGAEHSATKKCAERAARLHGGPEALLEIRVQKDGSIDRGGALEAIRQRPAILSLILLNNETGVISDLAPIGAAARAAGVLFHIDAVQAPGKMPIDVEQLGCDYLSLSAHKFHGPRGMGALFVRSGAPISPLMVGGPQELERRAGTENVPGIVGMGVAAKAAARLGKSNDAQRELSRRRDRLEKDILAGCPGSMVHGGSAPRRAAGTTNIGFDLEGTGLDATGMLGLLHDQGMEVSAGSACNSSQMAPSRVLTAMGCDEMSAASALRFSMAHAGTPDAVADEVIETCARRVIDAYRALAALKLS